VELLEWRVVALVVMGPTMIRRFTEGLAVVVALEITALPAALVVLVAITVVAAAAVVLELLLVVPVALVQMASSWSSRFSKAVGARHAFWLSTRHLSGLAWLRVGLRARLALLR
jgi:hypothetical protein